MFGLNSSMLIDILLLVNSSICNDKEIISLDIKLKKRVNTPDEVSEKVTEVRNRVSATTDMLLQSVAKSTDGTKLDQALAELSEHCKRDAPIYAQAMSLKERLAYLTQP